MTKNTYQGNKNSGQHIHDKSKYKALMKCTTSYKFHTW